MSELFGFLLELLRAVAGAFSRKSESRRELESRISALEADLAAALADGRLSDAAAIRRELEKLYGRRGGGTCGPSAVAVALAASVFLLSGCMSGRRGREPSTVFVSGNRVLPVAPGDQIAIPALVPPARQWYLVDDVGLLQWLGIHVDYGKGAR